MVTYDPHSALIVVDVQNDFASPEGALSVPDGASVVPILNRHIRRAAEAGAVVVYTQDWHPPVTPHFAKDGGRWPVHCVRDTWGAALAPDLEVAGTIVRKGVGGEDGYSGFSVRDPKSGETKSTGLAELLRSKGVERVVIGGLATDYCVKETALDAVAAGFSTTVLEGAVRAVDLEEGDGRRALEALARAGVHVDPDA